MVETMATTRVRKRDGQSVVLKVALVVAMSDCTRETQGRSLKIIKLKKNDGRIFMLHDGVAYCYRSPQTVYNINVLRSNISISDFTETLVALTAVMTAAR